MNAVVQFQPAQHVAPAFTMSDMERVALAIAKGGLFGSTDPNAVLTLCMVAQAEGKHPGLVMQQYHIINGKPAKKAEAMLVDFLASGGRVEWHNLDDECADATFSHPAGGSARITWDKARVAQAQLGGNAMHKKYPRQMLRSRVVSEGVRTVFPGATSGMYVPEEVEDFTPASRTPPTPQAQRARDLKPAAPALTDDRAPGRDKADQWVGEQLQAVDDAADAEALDAVIAAGNKAVSKLAREHPDLHDRIQQAYEARAAALNGYGPDDTQRGESHNDTDADHPSRKTADMIIAKCAGSTVRSDVTNAEALLKAHREAMSDALIGEVEAAIDAALARM